MSTNILTLQHCDLVGKYNISVSHMLQGLFDNNI